jgi:hypothetical protein
MDSTSILLGDVDQLRPNQMPVVGVHLFSGDLAARFFLDLNGASRRNGCATGGHLRQERTGNPKGIGKLFSSAAFGISDVGFQVHVESLVITFAQFNDY